LSLKRERGDVMLRRELIVAVLATFLLTSMLFMMIPTTCSPAIREYDPWLDYNDDGKISLSDLVSLAMHYGTSGDPAKPVIINHNWKEGNFSFNLNPNKNVYFTIPVSGFQTLTVYIRAFSNDEHKFEVYLGFIVNGSIADEKEMVISLHLPIMYLRTEPWGLPHPANFRQTYTVGFSKLIVWIYNNSTSYSLDGCVYYYLTT